MRYEIEVSYTEKAKKIHETYQIEAKNELEAKNMVEASIFGAKLVGSIHNLTIVVKEKKGK